MPRYTHVITPPRQFFPSMNTKETFIIKGLAGQRKLKGAVEVNGAKNAALKAMAASVLFDGPVTLNNIPDSADVKTMNEVLMKLGAKVDVKKGTSGLTLTIDPSSITSTDIDRELAVSMRSSVVLTGPLLSRYGKVTFPAPGGCVLGTRPIDLFVAGYEKMGTTIVEKNDLYEMRALKNLEGAEIFFNKVTVGGTETLMMAAILAKGTTILKNCALEPEIINVAEWLNACGAHIEGIGTTTLRIEGTNTNLLSAKKAAYTAIPDRIEAGSYLILGALCASDLTVKNCRPDHMESVINALRDAGVSIEVGHDYVRVTNAAASAAQYKSVFDLRTHEYPGFPTDLQAPMVAFLTQAEGESRVFETIYEGRFKYVEDLTKLGANITVMNPREILIKGPTPLRQLNDAEELRAHDIRAGFAIVMAALMGTGEFKVNNIHLIDRGYERLEERLGALGAQIERMIA